ncbi:M20/M25/M40 family metallo-hydrolase [Candidatus Neptunochlamydia vexilliferae]|uniref:Peptidase M20 dimerisation domain-containing protein n=1 Tax=Candidatus Neptunichlamydia vexilliferae TaxID=1651774 RepID=A0ABS0B008_9BACT|nr:M20/M25/M40 family metallo-hydrolase [Candidatus Neptunochlamydia vexilliferae]MBF5059723.1 hypothetical protein [Candidatus Neptunochlamydia vexilliferae]
MVEDYDAWFEKNRALLLEDFFTFLRFPSISTDPAYTNDLLACKDWLVAYMEKSGLNTEVWETSGHPTIFASHLEAGDAAPTLLFYGHYDVQPSAPLEKWESPPFEPEVRGHKVYARGAIDNKGQAFYTLLAIRAFLERTKNAPVNIKVLIEGEEEIGSSGLEAIAEEKKEALKADHIYIVDLDMYAEGIPGVTLGVRGVASLNVTVHNSNADLHSGTFGGIALNPARALATTLSKLWDEKGKVTVPHFYDGVKEGGLEGLDEEIDLKKESAPFEIKVFQGEGDYSLVASNWVRPTLEINGLESGYTGEGYKTIIPAEAMVKLSCRLVPGQDPEKIIEALATFLKSNLPAGIGMSFEKGHGTPAMITAPDSATVKGAIAAYERIFSAKCRRQLCGGTIPIAPKLAEICGGEIVLIGMGIPSDSIHAPNENFGLDRFKQGFLSITQLLEIFAEGGPDA